MRLLSGLVVAVASGAAMAGQASAATIIDRIDATVVSNAGSAFSFPIFRFYNLSTSGIDITRIRMSGGAPWDWVANGPIGSESENFNPSGGARTLIEGEERTTDGNNGCTAGITYNYTSFNTGDFSGFAVDPETASCGSAVVDVRPFLDNDRITITANFSDGGSLSGSDWTRELINSAGNANDYHNQRYRLTLERRYDVADPPPPSPSVPEPATWMAMLLGFGAIGQALRRAQKRAAQDTLQGNSLDKKLPN